MKEIFSVASDRTNASTDLARGKDIIRVTRSGMILNLLLAMVKLAAGLIGHSAAMIADAVHSLSDFFTDVVVILFVGISSKPRDREHEYGHGKFETLATALIGAALIAVALLFCWNGGRTLLEAFHGRLPKTPGILALGAAVLSILVKELIYRFTIRKARSLRSQALEANAWHHRSDALSSVATFLGIGGAMLLGQGWSILDPLAAIAVALLILKVGIDVSRKSLGELLEHALDPATEARIMEIITRNPLVISPHDLKTRKIGNDIAVEVHILVDGAMSVRDSHRLTEEIEANLRREFGEGACVSVHVEPLEQ